MSDSYQAVYDAVRSRLSGCNVGEAVGDAARNAFDFSHHAAVVAQEWSIAAAEQCRPSVLMRPSLSIDGSQWCALYGEDLQCGVSGFGDSPESAMRDFDTNWSKKIQAAAKGGK